MPRWRFLTWVILAFNLLMAAWLIFGVSGAVDSADCGNRVDQAAQDACEAGTAVGAGVGGVLIFVLWALGDVILGVIWLITKSSKRDCPGCGHKVKKGRTACSRCGFDFRLGGQPQEGAHPVAQGHGGRRKKRPASREG